MKKLYLVLALTLLLTNLGLAQNSNSVWSNISESSFTVKGERRIVPVKYSTFKSKYNDLQTILFSAPFEFTSRAKNSPLIIQLPSPSGELLKFSVTEYSMMEPALATTYPDIKTYNVQGIDDPYSVGTLDLTMNGFHAMILSPNGNYFIDPFSTNEKEIYICYFKSDFFSDKPFECLTPPGIINNESRNNNRSSTGEQLRTYRLACAATGEYTGFHGGTVAAGLAAIVTAINRINSVYQRELSVRLTLVGNNNLIVFTNAGTDPYDNFNGGAMLGQNQTRLDLVIGSANYDVGHVFSTGGGGIASLNSVCVNGSKAQGVTGLGSPIGDPFYIDYVAHEMGHQYGGNHSFNGVLGSCGGNRNASTAYEPGSGSTIMAYAGICGGDDLQPNSDAYFHTTNYEEIRNYTQFGGGNSCPVITATGNTPPTVFVSSPNTTIPISTPFEITGSATDAETPGSLTYCWEQYDLGPAGSPNSPSGNAPIFRSFSPVTSPTRTFPKLSSLLNNTTSIGEILPTYTRSLHFELTARDNNAGAGGVSYGAGYFFNVSSTAGPFLVTQPNTPVDWYSGDFQLVTWDVAGTTSAPVSCGSVNIRLSVDGGFTFPTVLASNTPNDGSQFVVLPNTSTSQARIKVEAFGNIFFDISNTNFTITGFLCENLSSALFPPPGWGMTFTGTNYWSRNAVSAYGYGSGSLKFDYFSASVGTIQSLNTLNFAPAAAGTYLTFDNAYAPYSAAFGPDILKIETSVNSGASYSALVTMEGRFDGTGDLNTAPPILSAFAPASSEWRSKIFVLPVGTNKIRFTATSGFGNNLYLDNICVQTLPAPSASASIGVLPEGFYRTPPPQTIPDIVRVYLHRLDFPNVVVDSAISLLTTNAIASSPFERALSGTYYIVVKHRNSIETWSKAGGENYGRGSFFAYNFVQPVNQAYGYDSQALIDPAPYYGMYGGDVDQDYSVNLADVSQIENAAFNFLSGYVVEDLTGDDLVDLNDQAIADNNSFNFVIRQAPPGAEPAPLIVNDSKNLAFENDAARQKYELSIKLMKENGSQIKISPTKNGMSKELQERQNNRMKNRVKVKSQENEQVNKNNSINESKRPVSNFGRQ
ncbi:MAG: M12 family metallo-peptidase [Bacteroidota bacterium]|nr:M12 family metallo-peptidase [Bacteroidota bacterium]